MSLWNYCLTTYYSWTNHIDLNLREEGKKKWKKIFRFSKGEKLLVPSGKQNRFLGLNPVLCWVGDCAWKQIWMSQPRSSGLDSKTPVPIQPSLPHTHLPLQFIFFLLPQFIHMAWEAQIRKLRTFYTPEKWVWKRESRVVI